MHETPPDAPTADGTTDVRPDPGRDGGKRLPLHVITGFLGSGKTAIVRALLERTDALRHAGAGGDRIAVLVNEVGELGIDHHLLERVDEDVLMLPGGCICCAMRDELYTTIERITALRPDRIVLETSGLADPAPLLHTVGSDPRLAAAVVLAGVVAVVDCLRAEDLLATQHEVRRQLEFADRVVLTKTDLAPQRVDDVHAYVAEHAPGREVRPAEHGLVDPDWLLRDAGFAGDAGGVRSWLARPIDVADRPDGSEPEPTDPVAHEHASYTTHGVQHDEPVDLDALLLWLRLVTQLDGPRLLRIKGIVRTTDGATFAVQSAERSLSPPLRLAHAPAGIRGAELVIIERGMPTDALAALLDSLRDALRGSRTDEPAQRS